MRSGSGMRNRSFARRRLRTGAASGSNTHRVLRRRRTVVRNCAVRTGWLHGDACPGGGVPSVIVKKNSVRKKRAFLDRWGGAASRKYPSARMTKFHDMTSVCFFLESVTVLDRAYLPFEPRLKKKEKKRNRWGTTRIV